MTDPQKTSGIESISSGLYDVNSGDPRSELVDRSGMAPEDVHQITRLMNALSGLRNKEKVLAEASEKYMQLNNQDMRALHFLIVANHRGHSRHAGHTSGNVPGVHHQATQPVREGWTHHP